MRLYKKPITPIGFPIHHCATCGHLDDYHLGHGCYYMAHSRKVGGYNCYCPCFFQEPKNDYDDSKLSFINREEAKRNEELD